MPRLVLFRSAEHALVSNPHAIGQSPPRFAGRRLRDEPPSPKVEPGDEHPDLVDHYEVCDEVLVDHQLLQDAAKAGDGFILASAVAKTRAEAEKLLKAVAATNAREDARARSQTQAESPSAKTARVALDKTTTSESKVS